MTKRKNIVHGKKNRNFNFIINFYIEFYLPAAWLLHICLKLTTFLLIVKMNAVA